MDAKQRELDERLSEILRQAATVACEIQKLDQGPGVPHYDQIETAAHEVGQQFSQLVQQGRMGEVAAEQSPEAACPKCGHTCPVTTERREVTSSDGPVEFIEPMAHCPACRCSTAAG